MTKNIVEVINDVLKTNYPIPKKFEDIVQLSQFEIVNLTDLQQWLPFMIDIRGELLSGIFTGERIQNVQTADHKSHTWKQFLILFHSFLNIHDHYHIHPAKFFFKLHSYPNIKELQIMSVKLQHNSFMIPIVYTKTPDYTLMLPSMTKNPKLFYNNHFYFDSFNVFSNQPQLTKEIKRLLLHRDEYDNIHFHLDNNGGGGDNTPCQLIVQCLVGLREAWMKPATKLLRTKTKFSWDVWDEANPNSLDNYNVVQKLKLGTIPNYNTKYAGKIYVHMNSQNGSAAWFFITYLIYAFAKPQDIRRFQTSCFGNTYKYGKVLPNHQLILKGKSGTTSGDGNADSAIVHRNIQIDCPTEQFISSSILPKDWNRFWSED